MSANRVFTPLMAVAALRPVLGGRDAGVRRRRPALQIITCQKHGGKAAWLTVGSARAAKPRPPGRARPRKPKTSAIYTCKSSSGSERLVSRATKCAKHERKLTWYQVKPSQSGDPRHQHRSAADERDHDAGAADVNAGSQPETPAKPTTSPSLEAARAKLKEAEAAVARANGAEYGQEGVIPKAAGDVTKAKEAEQAAEDCGHVLKKR